MTLKERLEYLFSQEDFIVENRILDSLVLFVQKERQDAYQLGFDNTCSFVENEVI